ncbi:flagellar biosynthesis protein FlhF [candidate division KSB1 bacterium]
MKIKKFTAPSMQEAMRLMKKELGENAVVLHTRKMGNNGMLNLPGKGIIEVTAAIDEPVKKADSAANPGFTPGNYSSYNNSNFNSARSNSDVFYEMIKSELVDVKEKLAQMGSHMKYNHIPNLPENLDIVLKQLIDNEIDEKLALELIQDVQINLKGKEYDNLKIVLDNLLKKIAGMIRCSREAQVTSDSTRFIGLIGPTGVGKTTTIAKLASNQKLIKKKKVGIITLDTYRIAAVEQLRTFANIAEIPFFVVYTPEEFKQAVHKLKNMDVVYIDTTGRSQKDKKKLKELKLFFTSVKCNEIHLCLSVTTKPKDMVNIVEEFGIFNYNHLIFTKLDETNSLGVVINTLEKINKPVSYITTGQNVPDDIERATSEKLAKMVIRRKFL